MKVQRVRVNGEPYGVIHDSYRIATEMVPLRKTACGIKFLSKGWRPVNGASTRTDCKACIAAQRREDGECCEQYSR